MTTLRTYNRLRYLGAMAAAAMSLALMSDVVFAGESKVTLSGDNESPTVTTTATGSGSITINDDMSVSGSITTSGVTPTGAHIHMGPAGVNGPVLITLTKSGDNQWTVPAGAKLTEAQYKAYKSGEIYVNVHSESHKGGEIRGQLK